MSEISDVETDVSSHSDKTVSDPSSKNSQSNMSLSMYSEDDSCAETTPTTSTSCPSSVLDSSSDGINSGCKVNKHMAPRLAISEDPEDDIEEFRRLQSINQDFINNCGRANALNNPNYGRGQRLKDISWLAEHLSSMYTTPKMLKDVHQFIFDNVGNPRDRKHNILNFNGFPFQENSGRQRKKRMELDEYPVMRIKQAFRLLNLNVNGRKNEVSDRIMKFFMCPTDDTIFKRVKQKYVPNANNKRRLLSEVDESCIQPRKKRRAATKALELISSSNPSTSSRDDETDSDDDGDDQQSSTTEIDSD